MTLRIRAWAALSRVPFTPQHRLYTSTLAWVDESYAVLKAEWGSDFPCPPKPSRHLGDCHVAVEAMLAVLRATDAAQRGLSGDEIVATLEEHMPSRPKGGST